MKPGVSLFFGGDRPCSPIPKCRSIRWRMCSLGPRVILRELVWSLCYIYFSPARQVIDSVLLRGSHLPRPSSSPATSRSILISSLSLSLSLSICSPLYFSLSSVSRLFWRENALTRTTRSAKDFEICCKPRWWIRSRTIPSSFEGNNGQWKGNSKNLKKRLDGERQGSTVEDNRGFEVEFDS